MILYFENSYGERRQIAEVCSLEEASREIAKFLDSHNFKSYYTRTWKDEEGYTWFDVGSHSEFFILK